MKRLIFLLLPFLLSCNDKDDVPEGILKPEKMQEVFWDFARADIYTTQYLRNDTSKNAATENLRLQEQIFRMHKTNKDEFYRSYTYYSNHKDLMSQMLDTIVSRQQRELLKIKPD